VEESEDSVTRCCLYQCKHGRHATADGESSLLLSYSATVMRQLFLVLLVASVVTASSAGAATSASIDSGREDGLVSTLVVGASEVSISDVPWQAALLSSNRFERQDDAFYYQFCGASIISDERLVTAAHCVDGGTQPSEVEVVVDS